MRARGLLYVARAEFRTAPQEQCYWRLVLASFQCRGDTRSMRPFTTARSVSAMSNSASSGVGRPSTADDDGHRLPLVGTALDACVGLGAQELLRHVREVDRPRLVDVGIDPVAWRLVRGEAGDAFEALIGAVEFRQPADERRRAESRRQAA